jgi:hypothetical protein
MAVVATVIAVWIAFAKLANDYASGLQRLSESALTTPRMRARRRWIDLATRAPPLRWWLRDPVARASFFLTVAYLVRDRDVKLRIYPAIAPMLALPVLFLVQEHGRHGEDAGGFTIGFAASYLSVVPMMVLNLVQYSQQWQAADVFRAAPLHGPAALCHGARCAILCCLALPLLLAFVLLVWVTQRDFVQLLLFLPGVVAMPVYALIPSLGGRGVPLSLPTEEAKGAGRGLHLFVAMLLAFALSGLATWSWSAGCFHWFIGTEAVLALCLYAALRRAIANTKWPTLE